MTDIEPAPLTRDEAVLLTNQIQKSITIAWDLIVQAYRGRAWAALGYTDWDAYCRGEFGHARLAIPAEERPNRVMSLRDQGLSIRAIASATGVSLGTVHNDLHSSGVQNWTPEVTGLDGKTYSAHRDDEIVDAEIVEEEGGVPDQTRAMKRVPLVKQFARPVDNVERAARRVAELSRDDRFTSNAPLLADAYLNRLYQARDFIEAVIDEFEKRNGAAQ